MAKSFFSIKQYTLHPMGVHALRYSVVDLPVEQNALIICCNRHNQFTFSPCFTHVLEDMAAVADMGEVYDLVDDIWFLYPEDDSAGWEEEIIDLIIGKGKLVKSQEIKNKDLLGEAERCYDNDVPKKVHQTY